jgi:hypothetical protein
LERLHFVPVFVRNGANAGKGNSALLQHGARPWPNPHDGAELDDALAAAAAAVAAEPKQESLSLVLREEPPSLATKPTLKPVVADPTLPASPADELLQSVRVILSRELVEPHSDAEVADLLAITKPQAKAWLVKLVEEGILEKVSKPARYRTATTAGRLL